MMLPKTILKDYRLLWKLAFLFTCLIILLATLFFWIATKFSKSYYTIAHQELYKDIASHLASFTQPIKNGKPDTAVTHDIIHSTMVANPSVEVYLLDTTGNITDYVVPDKTVLLTKVDMNVVKQWLASNGINRPMGDNPKQPGEPSIFSAAPVYENDKLSGYVYAVLSSEKQKEILDNLNRKVYLTLSIYILLAALITAMCVGTITFFLITRRLREIAAVVKRFKEGDFSARIDGNAKGDLGILSTTFNEMADVTVDNFRQITATDKFRQELIANVSHDLRTPLSILQGYTETLMMKRESIDAQEKEKYLFIINESAKKLSGLVEQLFQFAKLEANLIIPEKEAFLVTELVSDIMMAYTLKAESNGIQLKLEAPKYLPPVFADIALTERVFQNLLDNAFKFTPQGGCVEIRLKETPSGVEVQITDTGKGIPPEDQYLIFERYKQSQSGESKHGMGIGLSIVKKILDLHQISIQVKSETDAGTAFKFILPFTT